MLVDTEIDGLTQGETDMELFIVTIKTNAGYDRNVGENAPRSYEQCENDIEALEQLGGKWAEAEYRIIEVDEAGAPIGRVEVLG